MGLDFVELIMAVEDEFDVDFTDHELLEISEKDGDMRVGALCDLVLEKQNKINENNIHDLFAALRYGPLKPRFPQCDNVETFLRLRRSLSQRFNIPRRAFSTGMPLEDLFPAEFRRQAWDTVERDTELRLPRLEKTNTQKVNEMLTAAGCLTAIPALVIFFTVPHLIHLWIGLFVFSVVMYLFFYPCSKTIFDFDQRAEFPKDCRSFRDLIAKTAEMNGKRFHYQGDFKQLLKDYIWDKLVEITCEQLSVRSEDIQPHTCFFKDLGCD